MTLAELQAAATVALRAYQRALREGYAEVNKRLAHIDQFYRQDAYGEVQKEAPSPVVVHKGIEICRIDYNVNGKKVPTYFYKRIADQAYLEEADVENLLRDDA